MNQPYTRKKKSNTILACCTPLAAIHYDEIEAACSSFKVWNVHRSNDIGICVKKIIEELYRLKADPAAPKVNLEAIRTIFTDGGAYQGTTVNEAGLVTGEGALTYVPQTDPWTSNTVESINALISIIIPAIKYEGFSPRLVREAFLVKRPDNNVSARDLIMAFAAYAHIGNNISKLTVRRVNHDIGKRLILAADGMGIAKKNRTRNGLTLPRIVISFMPEYLVFRKFLAGDLQSQTESILNTFYKDVCFHGCPAIRSMTGYKEYHIEFSSYINEEQKDVPINDEKFLKQYKRWTRVSIAGYGSDTPIHERMTTAISSSGFSKTQAVGFIVAGMAAYRTVVE